MPDVTQQDIAAVVVLYRPASDVADNIAAFAGQVDRVYAVDNTENADPGVEERLRAFANLQYIPLGDNLGIAAALNAGLAAARDAGYSWALTMDQDSTADEGMVAALASATIECGEAGPIGVIAPVHRDDSGHTAKHAEGCADVLTVITSGDLLNIAAWDEVGRFDESLFIDQVDHELCLRLQVHGYRVVECSCAGMLHRLGAMTVHRFPRHAYVSNHSALRRYYITRNRLEVVRKYGDAFPKFRRREMRGLRRDLSKILLHEDHKIDKVIMSWRGYRDFRNGVSGKYRPRGAAGRAGS